MFDINKNSNFSFIFLVEFLHWYEIKPNWFGSICRSLVEVPEFRFRFELSEWKLSNKNVICRFWEIWEYFIRVILNLLKLVSLLKLQLIPEATKVEYFQFYFYFRTFHFGFILNNSLVAICDRFCHFEIIFRIILVKILRSFIWWMRSENFVCIELIEMMFDGKSKKNLLLTLMKKFAE